MNNRRRLLPPSGSTAGEKAFTLPQILPRLTKQTLNNPSENKKDFQEIISKVLNRFPRVSVKNEEQFSGPLYGKLHPIENKQKSVENKDKIAGSTERRTLFEDRGQKPFSEKRGGNVIGLKILQTESEISEEQVSYGDDIDQVLKKLRSSLGWKTELPKRNGQCKARVLTLIDTGPALAEKPQANPDNGSFVYCLPKNRHRISSRYNPYDLEVVPASSVGESHPFWTASATNVTMYQCDSQGNWTNVATPVLLWLWERLIFKMVHDKNFFIKFFFEKYFHLWKQNIGEQKIKTRSLQLEKRLFCVNDILLHCMVHVNNLCEQARPSSPNANTSSSSGVLCLIELSNSIYKLDDFARSTKCQRKKCLNQFTSLQSNIVSTVHQACSLVAEMEGIQWLSHPVSANGKGRSSTKHFKMVYSHIATWRKVLSYLGRFLQCIDYIIATLLGRLVKDSVKYLMKHLEASHNITAPEIKKVKDLEMANRDENERSFKMAILSNGHHKDFESLDEKTDALSCAPKTGNKMKTTFTADEVMNEIRQMSEEYVFPVFSIDLRLGQTVPSGHHSALSQNTNSPPPEVATPYTEMSLETPESCSCPEKQKSRRKSSGFSLQLSPSREDFFNCLEEILEGLENIISEFVPMKQEKSLSAFSNPTFGDAHQCDVVKDMQTSGDISNQFPWPYLDHLLWEDGEYQYILAKIRNFFKMQLKDIESYALEFTKYRRLVENSISVDRVIFGSNMDFNPDKYSNILASQTEMLQLMNDMTVSRRFGIMQIHSTEFYTSCIPYPSKVLDYLRSHIPDIAQKNNLALLRKIKDNISNLEHDPVSVEECVEHLLLINQINHDLADLEVEFNVVNKLFSLIRFYEMKINEESLALYMTLAPSFQLMKSTLIASEATKEGKIETFQEELDLLITRTGADVTALGMKIRDPNLLTLSKSESLALRKLQNLEDELRHLSNTLKDYSNNGEHLSSHQRELKRKESEEDMAEDSKYFIMRIFKDLTELERDLGLRKLVLEADKEWNKLVAEWLSVPFQGIDIDNLQKQMTRFTQTVYMLEKGLPPNELVPKLRESVLSFKQVVPIVLSLCNPSLKPRHWEQLEQIMGSRVDKDDSITLGILMEQKLFRLKDRIQEISSRASNEGTLETMLKKIIDLWEMTQLKIIPHANSWIIVGVEDLLPLLEESQVTIATIRASKYVRPIKASVEEWERKLQTMLRTLDTWLICQRSWIYFEEIFGALDIQRQLPNEYLMFLKVDRKWRELMQSLRDDLNVPNAILRHGLHDILQSSNMDLDKIQKSLEDYLETKRLTFPRFFFLSNEELLDVLANCRDCIAIQRHLGKCFGNIHCLGIVFGERPPDNIVSMTSIEGETVPLSRVIKIFGPVEQWLGNLVAIMFETVKRSLHLGLKDYSHLPLLEWLPKYPGQVILTVSQIIFSRNVQSAFNSIQPLPALSKVLTDIVESLNILARVASTTMSSHQTMSLEALLTISVHNRDIASSLIENGITSATDFQWTRQLRYEWIEPPGICQVEQSTFSFPYGYEYLGCSSRLVITPLTDRCYLTLTGAMQLNLGGSPSGPAGTGKSETVKDLAKIMGKQCVVFNCSEGLDYKMLSKFFTGLILSGSWCSFDEFNRIGVEVLSVVSQQLQTIKSAKDSHAMRFVFDGQELKLNPTCGFFITMNPTYAGRVELPDNLKALFRPVAMMVPDYALIAEIILFSQGFENAKTLSQKIINLYQLASRQLSRQDHYDFGMRAIKSVLMMAGHARKQASRRAANQNQVLSEKDECDILISSLRDANLPKFLTEDLPLFENILTDLFPDITPTQVQFKYLEKAIRAALREFGLQLCEKQITKIKQLYNQILVRDGVMLVGPADGGKTTVRNVLHRALDIIQMNHSQALGKRGKKNLLEAVTINPKCVTLQALYGWTDTETFEWTDGLLASTIRNFVASTSVKTKGHATPDGQDNLTTDTTFESGSDEFEQIKWKWLILDGPVDTLWVENLNTVLDDSRVLCLANGERVKIASGMRFLFEVDSLAQASPATISRCAMIYMDPVDLGWKPFVVSWFQRLDSQFPEEGREYLQLLFEASVDPGLKFLKTHYRHVWHEASQLRTVVSLCNILFSLLEHLASNGGFANEEKQNETEALSLKEIDSKLSPQRLRLSRGSSAKSSISTVEKTIPQKNPKLLTDVLGKIFVFAFTWSFGNVFKRFEDDDQTEDHSCLATEFDALVRDLFDNSELGIRLPKGEKNIYKYFLDFNNNEFAPWASLLHSTDVEIEKRSLQNLHFGEPHKPRLHGIMERQLLLTEECLGFCFISTLLLLSGQPVLLTGSAGAGKTILIKYILKELEKGVNKADEKSILGRIFAYKKEKGLFSQHENLSFLLTSDVQSDFGTVYDDGEAEDDTGMGSRVREPEMVISETCCSAQITAARLKENLCSKLINRGGNTLGALKGKKVIVFVDDLNMPCADEFGSHPPLELLRQVVERRGFYESKSLAWKSICDVTLVTAAGPPGGGRSVLSPRLLKHFCILGLPEPSSKSLQYIHQVELGSFFKQGSFMPEVLALRLPLVSACIQLYHLISASLKPTPRKSHYVFSLRDIAKVVQGLKQADDSVVINKNVCTQLFVHEATRVFHDRLVDTEDKNVFFNHLTQTVQDNFKRNWIFSPKDFVVFGDFFEENPTKKIYRPISDQEKLIQIFENYRLKMTFGSERVMQMVFFKEAVQHIMRASRVLRQMGGHLLMVGYDGTGKFLVSRFATFISGYQLYRLQLHRSYGTDELHEDLKKVFQQCGVQGLNTVLVISDQDIVKESFLEDINSILNSGEVPGLFDADELEGLLMSLKPLANDANIAETKQALYSFFIERVQRNLHVILSMNVRSGKFHQRCRVNPALINSCTIDWYDIWDREAMLNVANAFISDSGITYFGDDEPELSSRAAGKKLDIVESCVQIYDSVLSMSEVYWTEMRSHVYFTPADYMEFVQLYSTLTSQSKKQHMDSRNRLQNGIQTIVDTNASVAEMKEDLVLLGPKIEEKAKETDDLLSVLTENQADVEQVQQIVEEDERIMKMEAKIIQEYAQECTNDLESVLPELRNAQIALSHLDKASISELRVYTNPPQLVIEVLSAVCVLFQKEPTWPNAKLMLADTNFLKQLIEFDKDSVSNRVLAKLRTYTQKKDFNPQTMAHVSVACRSICQWLLALEQYYAVTKMVKPKRKLLIAAEEALKMAEKRLASKQRSLKKVQNHWRTIQEEYESKVNEREVLKKRKELIASRLKIAGLLIAALADEEDRWLAAIHDVNAKLVCILGDNLIGSATVCFAGPFTSKYRSLLVKKWKEICLENKLHISENFDVIKNMVHDQQILNWNSQGLPRNSHSVENAILMTKNRKWPLFIDPEGQATRWIKQAEGSNLKVASSEDFSYMRTVERCLRMGDPLLLTDVGESLDPALRPVLTMDTFHQGGTKMIRLGETAIEYNDNFKLYLVSSLNKPHFLPPVGILVNVINFTVTVEALKEHLLSTVIMEEKAELENQRIALLSSLTKDKEMLRELEDKSLLLLQKSEKHILDDEDLVVNLQKSRDTSQEIYRRVAESEEGEKENQTARRAYVSVATRGTVLYFTVVEMSQVDSMYQFSLGWFQDMFKECLHPPAKVKDLGKFVSAMTAKAFKPALHLKTEKKSLQTHLTEIINRLTSSVYRVVSRSLFARHQHIFSFLLCTNIMRMNDNIQEEEKPDHEERTHIISELEWQIFLQGNILAKMEEKSQRKTKLKYDPSSFPSWISDTAARQCELISRTFPGFHSLCSSLVQNPNQWTTLKESHSPLHLMKEPFPSSADDTNQKDSKVFSWEKLSSFQRLLLVKLLCPESLISSIKEFITDQMGDHYLSLGGFDLKDVYQESSCSVPLIFILSPGCDPAMKLLKFAKDLKGSHRHLDMVSLGRGQGLKAEELINRAQMQNGRWVFLQNCHLAASWMPQLQAILEKLNNKPPEQRDPNFRLWLSSKPDQCFPVQILQKGIKLTIECPSGLKAGMQRCFDASGSGTVTPEMFDDQTLAAGVGCDVWKKLLFGLCLFNNIVHERKKYGTLGWNIPYEFNDSDLQVSILHLHMLLSENKTVPWSALTYLTGEVNYGGRVTDDQDRLCLENVLSTFFCPESLSPKYTYSPDGIYKPLSDGVTFEDVVKLISCFPSKTSTDLFGMSEDAQTACQQLRAQALVDTLTSVQPVISSTFGGSKQSTDHVVVELCDEIQSKLPLTVETMEPVTTKIAARFFKEKTLKNFLQKNFHGNNSYTTADKITIMSKVIDELLGNSPLVIQLQQELTTFNHLLELIHDTLSQLKLAISGEIIMSAQLEDIYHAMFIQQVPAQFKKVSYECCQPLGEWVTDLLKRVQFFFHWSSRLMEEVEEMYTTQTKMASVSTESPSSCYPGSYWLPAFSFPQGFLTAVLQTHARNLSMSIDMLEFGVELVFENDTISKKLHKNKQIMDICHTAFRTLSPPEEGVFIFGLYLDSAMLNPDTKLLCQSPPRKRFCQVPHIHLKPRLRTSPRKDLNSTSVAKEPANRYNCPVYRTMARSGTLNGAGLSTNYIMSILLPTDIPPRFWILRGTALLCQISND